ncbi:armadillo-type protein [Kockovaella imperatae]|uniref:Armadillo-type protein n=1 Tax=Kockovaella imperatae TaxID=4999 RepID=A0A1Y1U8J8_9TREE|nr:armadillo-type protein [Kockovaella imperatae]ORX34369.1 armadillo-type protein [Kockovaella imperatae]
MASDTFSRLESASTQDETLRQLKELKNAIIGNTWRKVEVAQDEHLIQFLLGLIGVPSIGAGKPQLDIINETVVIFASLANVGPLTLRPLLAAEVPAHLLNLVNSINRRSVGSPTSSGTRLLAPVLRALRNILVSTADTIWGQPWGVGVERKVVDTGLMREEDEQSVQSRKGKGVASSKGPEWSDMVSQTLPLIFEPDNLDSLLSLIYIDGDPQTLLPLFQLLARLIALPYHRRILASWTPPEYILDGETCPGVSPGSCPVVVDYLLQSLTTTTAVPGRKSNAKYLEAILDLVAATVKGQPKLANLVRKWSPSGTRTPDSGDQHESAEKDQSGTVPILVDLLRSNFTSVRIAAAACLTNLVKAEKGSRSVERIRSAVMTLQILVGVVGLLRSEGLEEKVKLCFILAALVSDDARLQKSAADQGCSTLIMEFYFDVDKGLERGDFGIDVASRGKEAALLALAALSFQHEPTRAMIAEAVPAFLPQILKCLSHPSYGVRAAACQLTRALSRTVAILRTSLVDSGVGEEVIMTLKREVENHSKLAKDPSSIGEDDAEGSQDHTVEVAATATLCNLIADYSPLKMALLREGGLELLCSLTHSPSEPLALNALWALKNLVFHGLESLKSQVMSVLTWSSLRDFIDSTTSLPLRVQAMEILQNILADATPAEISKAVDHLGEEDTIHLLKEAVGTGSNTELRVSALFVFSNLALGNDKARAMMTSRPEILNLLSEALNAKENAVKIPALRCLRHLVETNAKSRRPRQAVVDLLGPYGLKGRLKNLADHNPSLDVCHAATNLLEVLERSRESGVTSPTGTPTRAIDVR